MRKDVKIGLAIGGIVLAVLIVYVLKVPNEQNKEAQSEPQKVAQTEPDIAMAPPATQPAQVAIGPATQPSQVAVDPFAARPTTAPSGGALSITPTNGDKSDWGTALSTGQMSLSASHTTDTGSGMIMHTPGGTSGGGNVINADPPPVANTSARTHTVQKGETLSSIAQMAYGNANLYSVIVKANPKVNPSKVRPGTVLVLPDASSVVHTATAGTPAAAPAAALDSKHYRVLPGDSLQKIASKLYGTSDKWEKIYDLNKSKIGSDPHKIKAEMVLVLPDEPAAH